MKVGIIGAGTMGAGIAQAFAQTEGFTVALCDINNEFAANGKNRIAKGFEKRIAKGKMEQAEADTILSRITTGTKEICADCDLIIEAAIENMEIKNFQCDKIIHLVEDDKFESISFEKFVNLNSDMYKIHDCNMINFELEI